jgi:hypothetical protein
MPLLLEVSAAAVVRSQSKSLVDSVLPFMATRLAPSTATSSRQASRPCCASQVLA